jgi:uncharacterized protein (UPF0335 family)
MTTPRERLVRHVRELERLVEARQGAVASLASAFADAKADGFDPLTLRVVLKLRKMSPGQRQERRALEAIYMAALGMLDGEALPDVARRRFEEAPPPPPPRDEEPEDAARAPDQPPPPDQAADTPPVPPAQPALALKDPEEARREGGDAAAAGKRIYDNPYPAGDPCRAAWDEGWCAQRKSHGMDPPAAYQRRTAKPPDKKDDPDGKGAAA